MFFSPISDSLFREGRTMGDSPKKTSLYVDNMHPEVEEKDLEETFGAVGPLVSVNLRRKETPRELLCCAVVNFHSHTDACTALESLNGTELRGKPIRILWENDGVDCDHVDYEEGSEGKQSSKEKEDGEGDCDHVNYEEEEVPEGEESSEEEEDYGHCDHVDYGLEESEFSEEESSEEEADDEEDCDHVDYEEKVGSEEEESLEEYKFSEEGSEDCDHVDYEEEEVPEGEESSEEEEDGDCDHVDYEEKEGSEEEESLEECEFSEEGSEDYQDDSYDYTKDPNLMQSAEDELADFDPDWFLKQLMGKGLAAAAIYTLDCGMLLDDKGEFPVLTKDEFRGITRKPPPYLASELLLGGQSYRVIENEPHGFLLCVSMEGAARGCAVKRTDKLLVLGYYRPPTTAEQCAEAVHTVGKEILYEGF